jgi:hypothetical protein
VGLGRLELPTSPLSGVRSSHLSYRPNLLAGNILRDLAHSSNNGAGSVSRSAGIKKSANNRALQLMCVSSGCLVSPTTLVRLALPQHSTRGEIRTVYAGCVPAFYLIVAIRVG